MVGDGKVYERAGGRVVSGPGGKGKGGVEIGPHIASKGRHGGRGVGRGAAAGAWARKTCML